MADFSPERSGFEPELGGFLRDSPDRTGFEPELGGLLRQKAVYVDEVTSPTLPPIPFLLKANTVALASIIRTVTKKKLFKKRSRLVRLTVFTGLIIISCHLLRKNANIK